MLKNKKFKKAIAITISSLLVASSSIARGNNKPKIRLNSELKNSKTIEINEGEKVLVKATAKDKEDGNLTKKIKINVKKPVDGEYKIGKKYIRFINPGTYKITFSVKDSDKAVTKIRREVIVNGEDEITNKTTVTPAPTSTKFPSNTNKPIVTVKPVVTPTKTPSTSLMPSNPIKTPSTTFAPSNPENTPIKTPSTTFAPSNPENTPTKIPSTTFAPSTPTNTPTSTVTPSPTPEVFNPDVKKFNAEVKKFGGLSYNVTTQKITNSNFNNNASSDKKPMIYIGKDYGSLTFIDSSNYMSNDGYLQYLDNIRAEDYKKNDITSNLIISTSEKFDNSGNLKTENDVEIPIYIYVEDKEGNSNTIKFYIRSKSFTKAQIFEIEDYPDDYPNLITAKPYIIFGLRREVIDEFNPALNTLKLTKN